MLDLKPLARTWPWLIRPAAMVYRYRLARSYYRPKLRQIRSWTLQSRELTNFTYDLEPANIEYMAAFIAVVTRKSCDEILGYFAELQQDTQLKQHIASLLSTHPDYRWKSDPEARYGRRLGWYAVVRAKKPKLVVETGVEKGLGAVVLAAALLRNRAEGHDGRYLGTDINPNAGHLLQGEYARCGQILFGDSCESLRQLSSSVELFINDSDHSAEYEAREYAVVAPTLSADALLISDNAHVTDALFAFARRTDRRFLFFQERPKDHWYPGAGIGVAFNGQAG
jgi:predicted O-methyltransferase YrrM